MNPCERRRSPGFTLLEVLAAVAVLGIVYVVVAQGAIEGLQTQGDAGRRLRASLLADRTLSELELAVAAGAAPEIGETQASEEDFAVVVEVAPFDLAGLLAEQVSYHHDRQILRQSFQVVLITRRVVIGNPTDGVCVVD